MPTVSGIATGGLNILSYKLEWNSGGSGTTFTALVGDLSNSLLTSHTESGLTTGTMYKFRYAVKNEVGWSPYSDTLTTYAAIVPA